MTRSSARILGALLGVAAIGLAACSLDPTRVPVPGAYLPADAYTVQIELSSALNLPARAKVDSGGIQVGVLDRVQLVGNTAVAYVDIAGDVRLPDNIRAELRQATILGDIYIALVPPDAPSPALLHDGDTVPLANTAPANNVEDMLRSMSNLVAGGTLSTLQDTVVSFNRAFPKDPVALERVRRKMAGILADLAANQQTLTDILSSAENISTTLAANTGTFDRLISEGPAKLDGLGSVTLNIIQIIVDFQDLGRAGGELLVPNTPDFIQMLSYVTPFIGTLATVDTTIPVIADKLVALVRDKLIGFFADGGPKFSVSEIHAPHGSTGVDPADKADQAVSAMRTMGLLP